MIPTAELSRVWSAQHTVYPGDQWAREMWNGFLDPHRVHLVKAIQRAVETPGSILEVGCGSGPNLRLCHAVWPSADLTGVDINAEGLDWGKKQAWSEGWDWYGTFAPLTELDRIPGPFDVVMSCYALTYVDRSDINPVLAQLLRLTKQALIIMEPMVGYGAVEVGFPGNLRTGGKGYPEYWYDYLTRFAEVLKGTGQVVEARVEPMPPHGHLNGVVTVLPVNESRA